MMPTKLFCWSIFILTVLFVVKESTGCVKKLPEKCGRTRRHGRGNKLPRKCQNYLTPAKDLKFQKGDVIFCDMRPDLMPQINHVMLATSSSDVIHISGNKDTAQGRIWEESLVSAASGYGSCQVYTDCMDCDMLEYDQYTRSYAEPYSPDESVERARQMKRDISEVYYDLFYCNCEHWVNYWRYGLGWSQQSTNRNSRGGKTNEKCRIPFVPITVF